MIREIVKDTFFLQIPSEDAASDDLCAVQDLIDTFNSVKDHCAGMAGNMIGIRKNMIIFTNGDRTEVMLNGKILSKKGKYETEEGCLSLEGMRKTVRYHEIKVEYQDLKMRKHIKKYTGYTAEIIQHELDHCAGIII